MNLYLKQKAFSWHDKAEVLDPEGQVRYTVEGDSIWSKKLHIRDVNGTEVAFLREKAWSWKPTFYMEAGGEVVAEIHSALNSKTGLAGPVNILLREAVGKGLSQLGISHDLSVGVLGTGFMSKDNKYSYNGKSISHADVLKMIDAAKVA